MILDRPVLHTLQKGDRVRWAGPAADPYSGQTLLVEQVYPPERLLVRGGASADLEFVAVSIGARPDVPHYETPPGETHEACTDPHPCKHYRGMNSGGADYRGRELAANLKKVD